MKFSTFREAVGSRYFTTSYVRQAFPSAPAGYLALQLTRWKRAGHLIGLRRGLYVFADAKGASLSVLANLIVEPSYLSGLWALAHYGMIPEAVWEFTSACRTAPRHKFYDTPVGRFSYRQVKFFGGYERVEIDRQPLLVATREKALLDTWYWAGGEWSAARHAEMRYQNLETLHAERFEAYLRRFDSPRLRRALESFRITRQSITAP